MKKYQQPRVFVYEGEILRAAQPRIHTSLKYYQEGRKVFWGSPDSHSTEITAIVHKLNFTSCK